jgi:hypothetical protein
MEPETQTLPHKKTYLEAALTPVTTPNNSPDRNIFIINSIHPKIGIIGKKLKWYINKYCDDEVCAKCDKGIICLEWNSYYTVYVQRYLDICNYKIKIYNDRESVDDHVYCDLCKDKIIEDFKIQKDSDDKNLDDKNIKNIKNINNIMPQLRL